MTEIAGAIRKFASKMFLAWLRLFGGFCVLMAVVGAVEGVKLVFERQVTWAELPAFLLHIAPSMLSLALLGSLGLLVVSIVIIGPIVWFSRRNG